MPAMRTLRPFLALSFTLAAALGAYACDDGTTASPLPVYQPPGTVASGDASTPADAAPAADAGDASPGADGGDGGRAVDGGDGGGEAGAPLDGGDAGDAGARLDAADGAG